MFELKAYPKASSPASTSKYLVSYNVMIIIPTHSKRAVENDFNPNHRSNWINIQWIYIVLYDVVGSMLNGGKHKMDCGVAMYLLHCILLQYSLF